MTPRSGSDQQGDLSDDEIELHFLPSYSPELNPDELNPDELVNAGLERSLPHTHRAGDQAELASATSRFFHADNAGPTSSGTASAAPTSAAPLPRPNEV